MNLVYLENLIITNVQVLHAENVSPIRIIQYKS
jgi:hypothetical protein